MNFKNYEQSYNLFNPDTATLGKYIDSNGNEQTSSVTDPTQRLNHSDYIPISSNSIYTFSSIKSGYIQQTVSFVWYTLEKAFISRSTELKPVEITDYSMTATSPNNAKYAIINYTTTNDEVMLNIGSTALPYEPYGNTWHDTPHYIHKTATDTITTLPADIYANDTTATVGLKGNMEQTGTPTPDSPIMPQGTGEMTTNEWNVTILPNSAITEDSKWQKYGSGVVSTTMYMSCEANTTYYLYTPSSITSGIYRVYTSISNEIPIAGSYSIIVYEKIRSSSPMSVFKFTTGANDKIIIVQVTTANSQTMADNAILDRGYKIPISSASTTTPVYLGEVETTRKIRKLVFDGTEDWTQSSTDISYNRYKIYISDMKAHGTRLTPLYCTHYQNVSDGRTVSDVPNNSIYTGSGIDTYIKDMSFSSITEFKTFLQQEYANGTPVCVWYVLATEETGIVNEPLMKIGDYADEVSGITIPTIAGADTLSVGTTLQPSEVTVNYHGWHDVQSVHERENGAWTE